MVRIRRTEICKLPKNPPLNLYNLYKRHIALEVLVSYTFEEKKKEMKAFKRRLNARRKEH